MCVMSHELSTAQWHGVKALDGALQFCGALLPMGNEKAGQNSAANGQRAALRILALGHINLRTHQNPPEPQPFGQGQEDEKVGGLRNGSRHSLSR